MAGVYVLQGPDRGQTFALASTRNVVGRQSADAPLNDHTVSRRHILLELEEGSWRLMDLGSSNGTYVNGERVAGTVSLHDGDQIKIGSTLLAFRAETKAGNAGAAPTMGEKIDLRVVAEGIDSAIVAAVHSWDESVILASPETADAVQAWKIMYELAEASGSILTVEAYLSQVTDIVFNNMIVDRAIILLRTGGDEMAPVVQRFRKRRERGDECVATSRRIIRHVVDTRNGLLCTDAPGDERFASDALAESLASLALQSIICVPILGHDGVHGVIHLDCPVSRHTYTNEQLRLAIAIGRVAGMAIENHRMLETRLRNERLAATGETVAYLSHYIRNILQGLRGGADVVELGLKRESFEILRGGWQTVESNLARILHLTTNMLTFSKDRIPRIESVSVDEIVQDAVELAARLARDRHVRIDVEVKPTPAIPVDPDGVHQALFNLISNAIAACPTEGGEILVSTCHDRAKNEVSIKVCDNGSGIPKDQLRRIFRPFHSLKGQGGTGLGLAAAKKVVEELAGRITVKSEVGSGTCFTIFLPVERTTTTVLGRK